MYLVKFFLRSFCSLAACCFAILTLSCTSMHALREHVACKQTLLLLPLSDQTASTAYHTTAQFALQQWNVSHLAEDQGVLYLYTALHDGVLDSVDHLIHIISCTHTIQPFRECLEQIFSYADHRVVSWTEILSAAA